MNWKHILMIGLVALPGAKNAMADSAKENVAEVAKAFMRCMKDELPFPPHADFDKESFCQCDATTKGDAEAKMLCMDQFVKDLFIGSCKAELRPKALADGSDVNCECYYDELRVFYKNVAEKPGTYEEHGKEFDNRMEEVCVKPVPER